jgi:hypothetical protein
MTVSAWSNARFEQRIQRCGTEMFVEYLDETGHVVGSEHLRRKLIKKGDIWFAEYRDGAGNLISSDEVEYIER